MEESQKRPEKKSLAYPYLKVDSTRIYTPDHPATYSVKIGCGSKYEDALMEPVESLLAILKIVFSMVVMMGIVKDYRGLVGQESHLSGIWFEVAVTYLGIFWN